MLQKISGMFFQDMEQDVYVSNHKDIIYSNLNIKEKIENNVFTLEPIYINRRINTYLLSYRYMTKRREGVENRLNPVAHKEIIKDIVACLTFWFKGIFITDMNYLEKLLRENAATTEDILYPRKVCPFIFDKKLQDDKKSRLVVKKFNDFFTKLIELNRDNYKKIITSIGQYYNSILLINLDVDLSYTSFVAILEALTQKLDGYKPKWEDYYEECRKQLDILLEEIDSDKADAIKNILLEYSHNKLAYRYYNFCSKVIDIDYFTSDAVDIKYPCKAREVNKAIKNSYKLRSGYIHELKKSPKEFMWTYELEICSAGENTYFTLQGIIRFTRYVICKLISESEKIQSYNEIIEEDEPGIFRVPVMECVHPNYWLADKNMFNIKNSIKYLNGILEIVQENIINDKKTFPDLRAMCTEIEKLIKGINNIDKQLPLIVFYKLYNDIINNESKNEKSKLFNKNYSYYLKEPSISTMAYYLTLDISIPWDIETTINLYNEYDKKFNQKNSIKLPKLQESKLLILLINNYADKEEEKYEYYFKKIIGIHPGNKFLTDTYLKYKTENIKQQLVIENIYK